MVRIVLKYYLGKTFSFPVIIIDAGLDADCIVCGVETLESVDEGDVELDLDPNPVAPDRFKPLDVMLLLEGSDVGTLTVDVERCAGLKGVKGGETARIDLGADDIAEVGVPAANEGVIRPGFSRDVDKGETDAGVDESVALIIGMSLIFGDDEGANEEDNEFAVI